MIRKSATGKTIRRTAADLPKPTAADMARLRAGRDAAGGSPIKVSASPCRTTGGASSMDSQLRVAIVAAMNARKLSGYGLWKAARAHCSTLPQSAVYEFLRGERAIGLEYIEALLAALPAVRISVATAE